jgi:hypothetical protein
VLSLSFHSPYPGFTPVPAGIVSGVYTMAEKTIKVSVKGKKEDISKEEATEQIISIAVEIVITTSFAMLGGKFCKKNKVIGSPQ